jgi:hypothetical protein
LVKKVEVSVACFSAKPATGNPEMTGQFIVKNTNSSISWHWDLIMETLTV